MVLLLLLLLLLLWILLWLLLFFLLACSMILSSHVCTLLTAPKGTVTGAKKTWVSCNTAAALVFTLALAEPGAFRGTGPHHAHAMIRRAWTIARTGRRLP